MVIWHGDLKIWKFENLKMSAVSLAKAERGKRLIPIEAIGYPAAGAGYFLNSRETIRK
jgi:hypothetical protein